MKQLKTFCRKKIEISKLDSSKNSESISNFINHNHENRSKYSFSRHSIRLKNAEISSSNHEDEEKSSYKISNTQHLSIKSNRRIRRIRRIQRIQQYKSKIENR
jgi:hypothetical protein